MQVTVTVVDNNSTDGTRDVIESFREKYGEKSSMCSSNSRADRTR